MDDVREQFLLYRRTGRPAHLAPVFDAVAQELLLVASHLASPGIEPEDLVQSTFLHAIEGADRFDAARPLMPWLIGILTNEARAAGRRARRAVDPERLAGAAPRDPGDAVQDQEFAVALQAALRDLPEPYRDVLTLRLVHGLTPTQIAHALGHPPGTVKSWVHRGIERLRAALPIGFAASLTVLVRAGQNLGDVRATVLEAARARAPAPAALPLTPTTLLASVGLILVLGMVWAWTQGGLPAPTRADQTTAGNTSTTMAEHASMAPPPRAEQSAQLPGLHLFTTDSAGRPLRAAVHLQPAAGMDPALHARWVVTGSDGRRALPDLAPGPWIVTLDRGASQRIVAAEAARRELHLAAPAVPDVRGRVLDADGAPIAGADVWLSSENALDRGHPIAQSDASGAFALVGIPQGRALSARIDGKMVGGLHAVPAIADRADDAPPVELRLPSRSATVRVTVTDPSGAPIPDALVMVGGAFEPTWDLEFCEGLHLRPPLVARTDARGQFVSHIAAPDRTTRVWARGLGFAAGETRLHTPSPGREATVALQLRPGSACRGTIRNDAQPVVATVTALAAAHLGGGWMDRAPAWAIPTAVSAADGGFALAGIPAGWARLAAREGPTGPWAATERTVLEGVPFAWNPRLGDGAAIQGRARGADGTALAGWTVRATAVAASAVEAETDPRGRFALLGLEDRPHTLQLLPPRTERDAAAPRPPNRGPVALQTDVAPGAEVDLRVPAAHQPKWFVRGWLEQTLPPDRILKLTSRTQSTWTTAPELDGKFAFGPVPPGTYYVSLEHSSGMDLLRGPIQVGLDGFGDADLGALRCEPPGQVRVRLQTQGATPDGMVQVTLTTDDGAMMPTVLVLTDGVGTSWGLPAGDYRVTVTDGRLALTQQKVTVSPGAIAEATLVEPPSVPVQVDWAHPAIQDQIDTTFAFYRDGGSDAWRLHYNLRYRPGIGLTARWRLQPGRYRVEARSAFGFAAAATFVVEEHGEPVSATLR